MKPLNVIPPDMKIEIWPTHRLTPCDRNARLHPATQVGQLANSLKEFLCNHPILVDPAGSILAGHAKLLAAKKLGATEVPVIVISHLNEDQKRAFRLADNQLALNSTYDFEILRLELEALAKKNYKLELTGFSKEKLAEAVARAALSGSDPDHVPELQDQPVTRPDDQWVLGKHRLLCSDATRRENLAKVLAGRPCGLIFADFPYNVRYFGKGPTEMTITNDDLGSEFEEFLQAACDAMLPLAEGAIYICMSSGELHRLHRAFINAGGHWSTYIIWAKHTFTLGRSDYQRQYEPILYGWRQGAAHHWCGDRNQSDVWFINKPFRNDLHPTMKPIELVERAIRNSSRPGDVVLDPFAGAGAAMIACELLDRQACLVEIDPRYVDASIRRWQELTGKNAFLAGEEKCFAEIEHKRSRPLNEIQNTL